MERGKYIHIHTYQYTHTYVYNRKNVHRIYTRMRWSSWIKVATGCGTLGYTRSIW